jgi:dTDP-4-dehydrorhamnose reductase
MKIVICGAGGMLGHVVSLWFRERYGSDVVLVARRLTGISTIDDHLHVVELAEHASLSNFLERHRPCVVINCAGATAADVARDGDAINSRVPHEIARTLDRQQDGSRLVHISTDGVFSGTRGNYGETDVPDAADPYGVSKRAGEVTHPPHLTIRTSIIGAGLRSPWSLLDWTMIQRGALRGFTRAIWSGVTTLELARFIEHAIKQNLQGICHLASATVSKYDLLRVFNEVFDRQLIILPDASVVIDRSLRTERTDLAYTIPSHADMLRALKGWIADHEALYPQWQSNGRSSE